MKGRETGDGRNGEGERGRNGERRETGVPGLSFFLYGRQKGPALPREPALLQDVSEADYASS